MKRSELIYLNLLSILILSGYQTLFAATGERIMVQPAAIMTWDQLVKLDIEMPKDPEKRFIPYMPGPLPREIGQLETRSKTGQPTGEIGNFGALTPFKAASGPPLVANFQALPDNNTIVPPDVHGAAGPSHLMTTLNSEVRIQDKSGSTISTVSLQAFWSSLGPFNTSTGAFDPRIVYDPGSARWMATAVSDPFDTANFVLFAISSGNDPTGSWTFYKFEGDTSDVHWADFPDIGLNSTWIAITANMFPVAGGLFYRAAMWVIDKSIALAGGPLTVTSFPKGFDVVKFGVNGFALRPCLTFGSESKLYLVDNAGWTGSGTALVRISEITGTGSSPTWFVTAGSPFDSTGLFFVANNFQNTQINASQAGTTALVRTNDARILNAVFRNGRIWCTNSGGLPASGSVDRTGVFWYQLDPTAMPTPIVQSGALDGGAGVHYYYSSIAANANDDALLGFSRSETGRYVEAAYTGRAGTDSSGSMDTISVLKAGEAGYEKDFGTGIRWGDYTAAMVDPADDLCFWSLQEYAALDAGPFPNDDRWGTWWGEFCPSADVTAPTVSITSPLGGESWQVGTSQNIVWTASDDVAVTSVDLYYSNNGAGGTYLTIASGESNDGLYAWNVPNDTTPNAFVKVVAHDAALNSGEDISDSAFSIYTCVAKPGDANASGTYTLGDVISIVNYIFNKPGCSPQPICWLSGLSCRGDWNASNSVTLGDVIQGVNFIFNKPGGPWNALPVGVCCL